MSQDAFHAVLPVVPGDNLAVPVHLEDDDGVAIDVAGVWTCDVVDTDGDAVCSFTVTIVGASADGNLLMSMLAADSALLAVGMLATLRNTTTEFTWARWSIQNELC